MSAATDVATGGARIDADAPLATRYRTVRDTTEALAAPLSAEDQCVQSMPDVSPTKWHRAHTTWFFETFVLGGAEGYEPFHPDFCYLFNSYYEAVGSRHPRHERGLITRPGIAEVAAYRRHVDDAMSTLVDMEDPAAAGLVELGLHHEQQHQELLLMDVKHVLSCNPLSPAYLSEAAGVASPGPVGELGWTRHSGGLVQIGHAGDGFAFDNESPRHSTVVEDFELADRLVTVGEWRRFVADGGYRTATLWLSDGWTRRCDEGWRSPAYWNLDADEPTAFTLAGRRPLCDDEPVCHVSYYEADAFARWAGARLASEVEWEVAATGVEVEGNLADAGLFHPRPANGDTGHQLFGDCWEWTASPYVAYPGYRPAAGAVGEYNGKFMVNQMVLRGGSCLTPPGHVRATYRNFFHPWTRWHASGVRLARDAS